MRYVIQPIPIWKISPSSLRKQMNDSIMRNILAAASTVTYIEKVGPKYRSAKCGQRGNVFLSNLLRCAEIAKHMKCGYKGVARDLPQLQLCRSWKVEACKSWN